MAPLVLTLSGPDRPGIVAAVAAHIFSAGGNILQAAQFEDPQTARFFMRVAFDLSPSGAGREGFAAGMSAVADRFSLTWRLRGGDVAPRVVVLVSKQDHCLVDLLYRQRIGELRMNVVAVVSNHPAATFDGAVLRDAPFTHLPIEKGDKRAQEARLLALVNEARADLVVLARYMQILSDEASAALDGRCINIHHSFLPSFKGARPYHQAHARGVKLIGATAHYVTRELDEGPIIAQDVATISHADSPDDLIRKGRDIERRVLARAVRLHLEDRVLLNGGKCVVFGD